MKKLLLTTALAALSFNAAAGGVDVSAYTRKDQFTDLKISPGGQYLAATVPMEDRSVLAIIERGTSKLTGTFKMPRDNYIADFEWISADRVVLSAAEKFGSLDEPQYTGELFAMNADGGKAEMLVGYRTGDMYAPKLDMAEALNRELVQFMECIENNGHPEADGNAGLRVVRILEAATQSLSQRGRVVELEAARLIA